MIAKILIVPQRVRPRFLLICGLAGELFEQPALTLSRHRLTPRAPSLLLHFFMRRVLSAEAAKLVPLDAIRIVLLILHGGIIALLADRTGH